MKFGKMPSTKLLFILMVVIVVVSLSVTATLSWAQSASPSPTPSASVMPSVSPAGSPSVSTSPSASPAVSTSPVATIPPEVTQFTNDWPLPNKDYSQTRNATSTINSSNVTTLGLNWQFPIPGIGSFGGAASNPIILGNTVYFQDLKANVYAMDLQTGQMKWQKIYNAPGIEGPNGPVVAYGKVFIQKDLYTMAALDANTGNELWSNKLSNIITTGIDIQPVAYNGLVYVSSVPGTGDIFYAPSGRGIIYALDQATGAIKWQFDTVKSADLFGNAAVNSGGGAWYPPAIDTTTGQTYWGVANPAPFPGTAQFPNGSSYAGDTLYTDSAISLNAATGALNWYHQVTPHDIFDHDLQISPILATATVNGQQQNIVLSAGKMGKVYAFNRDNGNLLWATNVGDHNAASELSQLPPGTTSVIPGVIGGVETPMSYADGVVYVPTIDLATDWTPSQLQAATFDVRRAIGHVTAINVNTGQALWITQFNYACLGATTVVNDLVFTGTYDGTIYALNRTNGNIVWSYKAPAGINAWPAITGDSIIWPAGAGNTPMINMVGTPTLLALKLGKAITPSSTPAISASPSTSPAISTSPSASVSPLPTVSVSPTPSVTSSPAVSASPTSTAAATTINLMAQTIAFNMSTITVKAGAKVTINFNNMDVGVPHNFAVYNNSSATQAIFTGQIVTGPTTMTYTFTAPTTPGTYYFRCDVHPTIMTGQFIVQ